MRFLKVTNWRAILLGALVLALCGNGTPLQAQSSPVGDWDFVLSGNQRGVAQVTFANDFTLSGIEIITVKPIRSTETPEDDSDERNPSTETGGGSTDPVTNYYGAAVLTGVWTYDAKGKVIGVISESGVTNSITNGISFRAVVRPGVRMSMSAIRNGQRISYRGVPYVTLADFSGNYYGYGKRDTKQFNELLTMSPSADPDFAPLSLGNLYDVAGLGPAYPTEGMALVSRQKYIALVSLSYETTNGILRSIVGPFKLSRGSGSLRGVSENGEDEVNVRMKILRQP